MKKILIALMLAAMTLTLVACSNGNAESSAGEATEAENIQSESEQENDDMHNGKILVAYFSATNTTEGVAQTMAQALSADLYEITPEQPYTDADLDYNDTSSRSTIEQNDKSSRPEISSVVDNMDDYDVVLIGYPIWWYEEPRIVDTFVESYDFSGKTVVPFCTSGGSGIGDSGSNLEALTSGATWLDGTRFQAGVSEDEIHSWAVDLGIVE